MINLGSRHQPKDETETRIRICSKVFSMQIDDLLKAASCHTREPKDATTKGSDPRIGSPDKGTDRGWNNISLQEKKVPGARDSTYPKLSD